MIPHNLPYLEPVQSHVPYICDWTFIVWNHLIPNNLRLVETSNKKFVSRQFYTKNPFSSSFFIIKKKKFWYWYYELMFLFIKKHELMFSFEPLKNNICMIQNSKCNYINQVHTRETNNLIILLLWPGESSTPVLEILEILVINPYNT